MGVEEWGMLGGRRTRDRLVCLVTALFPGLALCKLVSFVEFLCSLLKINPISLFFKYHQHQVEFVSKFLEQGRCLCWSITNLKLNMKLLGCKNRLLDTPAPFVHTGIFSLAPFVVILRFWALLFSLSLDSLLLFLTFNLSFSPFTSIVLFLLTFNVESITYLWSYCLFPCQVLETVSFTESDWWRSFLNKIALTLSDTLVASCKHYIFLLFKFTGYILWYLLH